MCNKTKRLSTVVIGAAFASAALLLVSGNALAGTQTKSATASKSTAKCYVRATNKATRAKLHNRYASRTEASQEASRLKAAKLGEHVTVSSKATYSLSKRRICNAKHPKNCGYRVFIGKKSAGTFRTETAANKKAEALRNSRLWSNVSYGCKK